MRFSVILVLILCLAISPCYAGDKKAGNKDEQKRIERVEKGIKALLEKEKCTLSIHQMIQIVPLVKEKKAEKVEKK